MERLAALEAEVKADAEAQRARKDAAGAKVRAQQEAAAAQRAAEQAKLESLRSRARPTTAPPPTARRRDAEADDADADDADSIGGALALAKRAHGMKQALTRAPKQGEKSWVKSGVASMLLGPLGWLYAGSMREAIPASAAWLVIAAIVSKLLPAFLLMPVLMVALPLSGIAGVVYALQYNRHGGRQRLFNREEENVPPRKQLKP